MTKSCKMLTYFKDRKKEIKERNKGEKPHRKQLIR